ncbi:MAG: MFS transporter, partial [Dehalococcoidia bacterium]|nr:MFS transporter [Dehalococcoidia bacterium]
GILALSIGPMIDRFGARWMLPVAQGFLGGALVLHGLIASVWQFYVLQIIARTITMGVVAMALQVVIPKWFVTKRGRAVALSGLGIMVGGTVTPLYVQWFVGVASWRIAYVVAGILVWVVSLVPAALFLRRQPEDIGLLPDGTTLPETESFAEGGDDAAVVRRLDVEVSFTLREVVRFPSFYLLVIAFSLLFLVSPGLILHMIPYFADRGVDAGRAVWVLVMWSACGALGALTAGFLTERFGPRRLLTAALLLMGAGTAFLLTVDSFPIAMLWGIYMGVLSGGVFGTLHLVVFADYYGRTSLGAIRGVVWLTQMMANAVGPLSAAIAYDIVGSYTLIFSIFAGLMLVAGVCLFLAKPPARSNSVNLRRAQMDLSGSRSA